MADNQFEDIADIQRALKEQERFIHYDTNVTHYTLTEEEMNVISKTPSPFWKDASLATVGFGMPTLLNAIDGFSKLKLNEVYPISVFLNIIFASVSLILFVIFAIFWYVESLKNKKLQADTLKKIKNKPKFKMKSDYSN
ncbi:MAG: hypothetical protein EAZ95_06820 [Bacteroidetes bacterium]|nr:MAG: hypothetical protein EAZ95_06820 [Bacteroidota bacterium]